MRWSSKSIEELEATYWDEIAPAMRRDDLEPANERPSYQWLVDAGFSGIDYALREHHDLTLTEFFESVVELPANDETESYSWGIDDERTREELTAYVHTLGKRRKLAESTCHTKRARLAKYARLYADCHGTSDLLAPAADVANRTRAIERTLAVFDELDGELDSDDSKLRYLGDVNQFYEHLVRRGKAAFNPVENVGMEYAWERSEPDNPALTAADVRAMYAAADSIADRLLVVGLAGWGLRPNELAALHRSQVRLDDRPHLSFEERKNGPGTVALIYGVEELRARLHGLASEARSGHDGRNGDEEWERNGDQEWKRNGDEKWRQSDDEEWNGYLFPSSRAASGHIATKTVRSRFGRLAERAGVRVRGSVPTPKMGRRFWYATYLESMDALLEQLDDIAADQGSKDPNVVVRNYLSEERRREHRRTFMRDALADAFEETTRGGRSMAIPEL